MALQRNQRRGQLVAKVSDKAKARMYEQQIALLDMIVDLLKQDAATLGKYVDSTLPDYTVIEGEITARNTSNIAIHYMRDFRDCVYSGITPSAAILTSIAEFFDRYLSDESGLLSLDESFKLTHKARIGSPLKQERWLQNKMLVLLAMWLHIKLAKLKGTRLSIENAAGKVIEEWELEADAEALKKSYSQFELDKHNEGGYYPATPEVIRDLEKGLEDAKRCYLSGEILEGNVAFKAFASKSNLEALLRTLIQNLGNK